MLLSMQICISRYGLLTKWWFKTKKISLLMLSCILRSPLQVAFTQAVRHDLSGGLLTCLVVLGQKCTIVCTGAERSSLWRRCRLRRRFPLCFRQMQQGCRCDDLSLSLNVCLFNVLMTWYILYLYYFTLNKSCLSLGLSLSLCEYHTIVISGVSKYWTFCQCIFTHN